VTTISTSAGGISDSDFVREFVISFPISRITVIAAGRTDVGRDPADQILTPEGASDFAIPSAIWLRAELATHRKRMPFIFRPSSVHSTCGPATAKRSPGR
jgi:hypothetical protein